MDIDDYYSEDDYDDLYEGVADDLDDYEDEEEEEEDFEEDFDESESSSEDSFVDGFDPELINKDEKEIMKIYNDGKALVQSVSDELKEILGIKGNSPVPDCKLAGPAPEGTDPEYYKALVDTYRRGNSMMSEGKSEMIAKLNKFVYYVMEKRFNTFKDHFSKDLYQEGVVGILKGIDTYDADISRPTTFFYRYILHEMTEFVNTNVNKTTSHYAGNINKVKKAINRFERAGREWTIKDIAQETGISSETIAQALNIMKCSNEMHYETLDYLDSQMVQRTPSPEEQYLENENSRLIQEAIDSLSEDEANVIRLKYGLLDEEPMSYKNISQTLGIQIDRVKKLNNSAIRKLRRSRIINGNFKNLQKEQRALNENLIGVVPLDSAEKEQKKYSDIFLNGKDEIELETELVEEPSQES